MIVDFVVAGDVCSTSIRFEREVAKARALREVAKDMFILSAVSAIVLQQWTLFCSPFGLAKSGVWTRRARGTQ